MQSCFEFEELPSTNEWLKQHALSLEHGSVCHALSQNQGRGRGGNNWVSKKGNLYCSLLIKPEKKLSLREAGLISFITSLALYDVLEKEISPQHEITLKWPNDILINKAKVSGILLETEQNSVDYADFIVVGFGVNVMHAPELNDKKTICLNDVIKQENNIDLFHFRDLITTKILAYFDLFLEKGFSFIRKIWVEKCLFIDKEITIRTNYETFKAVFKTIDEDGNLIALLEDGSTQQVSSAEVFF